MSTNHTPNRGNVYTNIIKRAEFRRWLRHRKFVRNVLSVMMASLFVASVWPIAFREPTVIAKPPATTTTTTTLVAPYIIAMWEKVAICETGGRWWRDAPTFDGGLGISRVNWQYYAPDHFPDAPHLASKEQQVYVARIIQAAGGVPNYIPDQAGGCHGW
jgi:uncharacterized membrane protein (DUF485 family)